MVSQNVRTFLKTIGQKGGKERAKKLGASALRAQARYAVVSRWMRKRFGTDHFKTLALPGWEVVDSGLRDLVSGDISSAYALAVAELRPRLRFLGVPVPLVSDRILKPREALYRLMEAEHGDMAHERFCALLARMDSFCDALSSIIPVPYHPSHRGRRWCA